MSIYKGGINDHVEATILTGMWLFNLFYWGAFAALKNTYSGRHPKFENPGTSGRQYVVESTVIDAIAPIFLNTPIHVHVS